MTLSGPRLARAGQSREALEFTAAAIPLSKPPTNARVPGRQAPSYKPALEGEAEAPRPFRLLQRSRQALLVEPVVI